MVTDVTTATTRVICDDHVEYVADVAAARVWLASKRMVQHCRYQHWIETLDAETGRWCRVGLSQTERMAALVLAHPVGDRVKDLIVADGAWSPLIVELAAAAGPVGSPEWLAAAGSFCTAVLSADGRPVDDDDASGCRCLPALPGETRAPLVAFERWSEVGMNVSGWACSRCRGVVEAD